VSLTFTAIEQKQANLKLQKLAIIIGHM